MRDEPSTGEQHAVCVRRARFSAGIAVDVVARCVGVHVESVRVRSFQLVRARGATLGRHRVQVRPTCVAADVNAFTRRVGEISRSQVSILHGGVTQIGEFDGRTVHDEMLTYEVDALWR